MCRPSALRPQAIVAALACRPPKLQARPCNWTFVMTCTGFAQAATEVSDSGVALVTTGAGNAFDINMAGRTTATTCTVALTVTDMYGGAGALTRANAFVVSIPGLWTKKGRMRGVGWGHDAPSRDCPSRVGGSYPRGPSDPAPTVSAQAPPPSPIPRQRGARLPRPLPPLAPPRCGHCRPPRCSPAPLSCPTSPPASLLTAPPACAQAALARATPGASPALGSGSGRSPGAPPRRLCRSAARHQASTPRAGRRRCCATCPWPSGTE